MTVQELINRLQAVDNKDMEISFYKGCFYYEVEDTEITTLANGKRYFNICSRRFLGCIWNYCVIIFHYDF